MGLQQTTLTSRESFVRGHPSWCLYVWLFVWMLLFTQAWVVYSGFDTNGNNTTLGLIPEIIGSECQAQLRETNIFGIVVRVTDEGKWRGVITQCVVLVSESTNKFYRRGEQITGRELGQRMQWKLQIVELLYSDPYGGEVAVVIDALTSADGLSREGFVGPRSSYEVEVDGKRVQVYKWLKEQLGIQSFPNESVTQLAERERNQKSPGVPLLMVGAKRFKALAEFAALIGRTKELITSFEGTFYEAAGAAVTKEYMLGLLDTQTSTSEFRHRYFSAVDIADFGKSGMRAVMCEFRRTLEAAYEVPESKSARAEAIRRVLTVQGRIAAEHRAYDILRSEDGMSNYFGMIPKVVDRRYYMVREGVVYTNVVEWIFSKLGLALPARECIDVPMGVDRILRKLERFKGTKQD